MRRMATTLQVSDGHHLAGFIWPPPCKCHTATTPQVSYHTWPPPCRFHIATALHVPFDHHHMINTLQVYDYGVPYDYGSIMHYGRTFFSMDGKSITLLPKDGEVEIGQRTHLSELDILQANKLYMCRKLN